MYHKIHQKQSICACTGSEEQEQHEHHLSHETQEIEEILQTKLIITILCPDRALGHPFKLSCSH